MSGLEIYLGACSFLLGAVIGSFLNVVIYRLPEGLSLVSPGSRCPSCGNPVRWYHNIPLLGWAILRGKCKDCGVPISWRYPFVEGLTGVLFLLAYVAEGVQPHTLITMAFFAALVAITFIDIDHFRIPDKIVLPGAVVCLIASVATDPSGWWEYLAAAVGGAAFLLILGLIWSGGMGMGDVKMALMMGAYLGSSIIVAFFVAFLAGGLGGLLLMGLGVKGRKDRIPFGPYLALGSVVAALLGSRIIEAYLDVAM